MFVADNIDSVISIQNELYSDAFTQLAVTMKIFLAEARSNITLRKLEYPLRAVFDQSNMILGSLELR